MAINDGNGVSWKYSYSWLGGRIGIQHRESDAKKDLDCIDDLEDESVFRGTELLMAWILSDPHGTQYVHVRDADGTYSEKLVQKHRNYVELFLEDSKTIKAFFKLHGGLFRETFKLVGKGSEKVLESTDKREISRNIASVKIAGIVVDSFGNIYSYKNGKCNSLQEDDEDTTECPCGSHIKGSCIYDKVAKTASVSLQMCTASSIAMFSMRSTVKSRLYLLMVMNCVSISQSIGRSCKSMTRIGKRCMEAASLLVSNTAEEDMQSTESSSKSYLSHNASDTPSPTPIKTSSPILYASLLGVGILLALVSATFIALLLLGKVCAENSDASESDYEDAISENSLH
uniref:Uncharacterized protein n=1 Tax=Ditylenchus dipsaci TaxID=166011 RepID=A0A915DI66_9BILA